MAILRQVKRPCRIGDKARCAQKTEAKAEVCKGGQGEAGTKRQGEREGGREEEK